jgi:hypothetical protein
MHDADMEIICTKQFVILQVDSCREVLFVPDITLDALGQYVELMVRNMRDAQREYMRTRNVVFTNH